MLNIKYRNSNTIQLINKRFEIKYKFIQILFVVTGLILLSRCKLVYIFELKIV